LEQLRLLTWIRSGIVGSTITCCAVTREPLCGQVLGQAAVCQNKSNASTPLRMPLAPSGGDALKGTEDGERTLRVFSV